MAIKININDKKVILASIYMDVEDESFPPKSLIELEKYAKQIDVPLIIGSDTSSHHVLWGDKKQDKRGEVLLEYLYSCDLSWANRGSKPTFVNSRGHSSVIDLTLTNNKGSDLINSWRLSDLISNSDHNYITFNIIVESKSTNITYNPTKTNWEKFENFLCNSSRCEYIKKLEITNEDMDIAAQELITLINEAMIASCLPTYITSTLKRLPWMTREVDEARANIRHRLKRAKKSKTRNNWNTYHSELKDYKKLSEMDPLKAAGPDQVQSILIQKAYKHIKNPLIKIYRQSHITGHIPKPWRETKCILLPKPGKVDYNDVKSYRTITLSSNFLKIHERMILWYIEHDVGLDKKLNKKQYGFRKGCSTDTALHKLVHIIERRIAKKGFVLGTFLDIEGAFDNISFNAIKKTIEKSEIDCTTCNWIFNMISNRYTTITLKNATKRFKITKGCPQGGYFLHSYGTL